MRCLVRAGRALRVGSDAGIWAKRTLCIGPHRLRTSHTPACCPPSQPPAHVFSRRQRLCVRALPARHHDKDGRVDVRRRLCQPLWCATLWRPAMAPMRRLQRPLPKILHLPGMLTSA